MCWTIWSEERWWGISCRLFSFFFCVLCCACWSRSITARQQPRSGADQRVWVAPAGRARILSAASIRYTHAVGSRHGGNIRHIWFVWRLLSSVFRAIPFDGLTPDAHSACEPSGNNRLLNITKWEDLTLCVYISPYSFIYTSAHLCGAQNSVI